MTNQMSAVLITIMFRLPGLRRIDNGFSPMGKLLIRMSVNCELAVSFRLLTVAVESMMIASKLLACPTGQRG
jgi:hypothetical protein